MNEVLTDELINELAQDLSMIISEHIDVPCVAGDTVWVVVGNKIIRQTVEEVVESVSEDGWRIYTTEFFGNFLWYSNVFDTPKAARAHIAYMDDGVFESVEAAGLDWL